MRRKSVSRWSAVGAPKAAIVGTDGALVLGHYILELLNPSVAASNFKPRAFRVLSFLSGTIERVL